MCLGGALEDGSKNIALHFESPRIHTGFPGIAGYATALIHHMASLKWADDVQLQWRHLVNYENKLMAEEGRRPRPGSVTADELLPRVNKDCEKIRKELVDFCCDNSIPGLIVHSGTDILFDIRTQELTDEDEAPSSDASEAALPEWYALVAGSSKSTLKWKNVYQHLVLTVKQINKLMHHAVKNTRCPLQLRSNRWSPPTTVASSQACTAWGTEVVPTRLIQSHTLVFTSRRESATRPIIASCNGTQPERDGRFLSSSSSILLTP